MANADVGSSSIIETYSLIGSEGDGSKAGSRLSAFIVRLTDASLKSLNEAVAESKRGKSKFRDGYVEIRSKSGNEGVLCFGGSTSIGHQFSMLDAQRDLGPTGQLEAIVEEKAASKKSGIGGRMKSVGSVTKRIQISATTADTFESTKQKTKQASEEMRKNAAKVLKGPTAGLSSNKKVWDKISKTQASTSQRPLTPLSHLHRSSSPAISTINAGKMGTPPINRRPIPPNPNNSNKSASANESTDDGDDGMQRVKTKASYRPPPPKRPATESFSILNRDSSSSISPSTAAAIEGVSSVTITTTPPSPPQNKKAISDERVPSVSNDQAAGVQNVQPIGSRKSRLQNQGILTPSNKNGLDKSAAAATVDILSNNLVGGADDFLSRFESAYPPIGTMDERRRYKQEFDRDYPSYTDAYERLRSLALEFEKLGEKLKSAPKSSSERKEIEKEISIKYKKFESDAETKNLRRRHEELKQKLHVIKTRVKDYDDKNVPKV